MIVSTGLALSLYLSLAFSCGSISNADSAAPLQDPQNTIYLDTKDGRITILLRPDLAPKHVTQIKALTKRGFYNGLVFHRVIDGFMAQTGDPTGTVFPIFRPNFPPSRSNAALSAWPARKIRIRPIRSFSSASLTRRF
jgi:peptidylprolyl isomerase